MCIYETTSRPNFNYIATLFQRQMPAGKGVCICQLDLNMPEKTRREGRRSYVRPTEQRKAASP